jgi:hypothetical protein
MKDLREASLSKGKKQIGINFNTRSTFVVLIDVTGKKNPVLEWRFHKGGFLSIP